MSDLGWKHLTPSDKQAILRGIEDGVAHGGPYHVEIHPADRCNIDCFFCSTAALRGTDEVPMTPFEELLGELREAGTRSLRLSGGGEPLFHLPRLEGGLPDDPGHVSPRPGDRRGRPDLLFRRSFNRLLEIR